MLDHVIRKARIAGAVSDHPVDIGFEKGRIAAIAPSLSTEAPSYDAGGCLASAGLIETHIHLDKSRIIDRCQPEAGRNAMTVKRVSQVKNSFTVEDVYTRAKETLENCVKFGTTRMRTHVEVDPGVGIRGFEGVQQLVAEYKWAIDLQLCVFPQEGLTNNPGTDELLVEGLKRGARAIGAAPGYDTDHAGQIKRVFDLAREYDVDIDMHLDFGNTPDDIDALLVAELTEKHKLGGRVAIGHVTKFSTMPLPRQQEVAKRMADAGVAITVLPATDLFLMGRDQDHNVRRGVTDAHLFLAAGCTCSISTNNILNPFTPFGDSSLVRMANLHANILQVGHRDGLHQCFEMISERSAKLLNLKDYGIKVGNPADVVIIDAASPADAVARNAAPLAVFKAGKRTVTRERAVLHRP